MALFLAGILVGAGLVIGFISLPREVRDYAPRDPAEDLPTRFRHNEGR